MSDINSKDLRLIRWPLLNPDTGILKVTALSWKDAEPAGGSYDFTAVEKALALARQIGRTAILRVSAEPPEWSEHTARDFIAFIRALGNAFDADPVLFSIDIVLPCDEHQMDENDLVIMSEAYMEAFPHTYKLADVRCGRVASRLKGRAGVGLVLDAREGSSEIGWQLARLGLQSVWENAPVRMIAGCVGEALMLDAIRWHVSSIDASGECDEAGLARIGHRIELRRVAFAESALPSQAVPLSVWIVNSGNAPCHTDSHFNLRLSRADMDDELVTKTSFSARDFFPGEDVVLEEEFGLAGLPKGEYDVQLGLFSDGTNFPVVLGIEGRISDGYYSTSLQIAI